MNLLRSFWIALSTYSAIPVPQFEWDDDALSCSFCFLPAVGLVIGLCQWGWFSLAACADFAPVLVGGGAAAIPLLVTGGIHMDGFCDTADALGSRQSRERCLEIMKDSRAGAFAVIDCGLYLMLAPGLSLQSARSLTPFCAVFVLSRAMAVFSVTGTKNARGSGMLATIQKPARRRLVRASAALWVLTALALPALHGMSETLGMALAAWAVWHFYHRLALRRFGGITGDTSGFFVQVSELCLMAGIVLGQSWRNLSCAFF